MLSKAILIDARIVQKSTVIRVECIIRMHELVVDDPDDQLKAHEHHPPSNLHRLGRKNIERFLKVLYIFLVEKTRCRYRGV